ncbi:o-succinylbenzoate synthase [Prochlorococcus marinus]|uniref:Putative O-succinylbenzoate synthase n=1 Tax=Prochlorococcus marinus (strain MIT 9211) TaxID=93059 RepID=A9BD36_PROM4|nr:o-succinylbenzoate synthase [Prochlorococcus marinus]ABX08124.1 putative O-succinylbenzoate synthase [Prochlorococcus marinus str. MIT 9211]
MSLFLQIKPFAFQLLMPLRTSQGILRDKKGFLIHLQNEDKESGWGEVAPMKNAELNLCAAILKSLGSTPSREKLERNLATWPGSLSFGIGAALAELDSLVGHKSSQDWLKTSQSALLLPTDKSPVLFLESILKDSQIKNENLTIKWKVGNSPMEVEKKLLGEILRRLPQNAHLRLDANGGWDRKQAMDWANHLSTEPKLEWIEQPLPANDISGLEELSTKIPVALDESLLLNPVLKETWQSWQIRKPLLEGDPRVLLKELTNNVGYRVISTSFETGIGRRWIHHLAALQQKGPTPTAPGLAPGWCPDSAMFSANPESVWDAA